MIMLFSTFLLLHADHWLIIANGYPAPIETIRELAQNRKVMVLDGAINNFKESRVIPDVLLGDFDSIEDLDYWKIDLSATLPYKGRDGMTIVPAPDQDFTDLEKGIRYCDANGAETLVIAQATGLGRLDHTLGNLGLLRKCYSISRPISLLTDVEEVVFIKDSDTLIKGRKGEQCAIMGYPQAVMTTGGLTYNGLKYPLELGLQESVCNTLAQDTAWIEIEGEALVIKPLHLTNLIVR